MNDYLERFGLHSEHSKEFLLGVFFTVSALLFIPALLGLMPTEVNLVQESGTYTVDAEHGNENLRCKEAPSIIYQTNLDCENEPDGYNEEWDIVNPDFTVSADIRNGDNQDELYLDISDERRVESVEYNIREGASVSLNEIKAELKNVGENTATVKIYNSSSPEIVLNMALISGVVLVFLILLAITIAYVINVAKRMGEN